MKTLIIVLALLVSGCGFNNASEVKDGTYKLVYHKGPVTNGMALTYDGNKYRLRFFMPPPAEYVMDRETIKYYLNPDRKGKYIYLTRQYLEDSGGLYFTSGGRSYVLPAYYIEGFLAEKDI